MRAFLVTHTHWDREWYRTYQEFRARLVDAVDRVLELCAADAGYRFLLDGQSIALEDYAAIRPGRVAELRARIAEGRIAIGPWYVQPDSLLPAGESHVRNLLEGRRAGEAFGPVSRVAYTPDSFGHPAQFPQLFAGFGLLRLRLLARPRGRDRHAPARVRLGRARRHGAARVPSRQGLLRGGDGSARRRGDAPPSASRAPRRSWPRARGAAPSLLLNGIDHALPEPKTAAIAEAAAGSTRLRLRARAARGLRRRRSRRSRAARGRASRASSSGRASRTCCRASGPRARGSSSRTAPARPSCSATRSRWRRWPSASARPTSGPRCGSPGARCSRTTRTTRSAAARATRCTRRCAARFEDARGLARETAARALERLAGGGVERSAPWSDELAVAVWNPSPHPRSGLVRFALDPHPWLIPAANPVESIHPLLLRDLAGASFTADGAPARLVPAETGRVKLLPDRAGFDLEFAVAGRAGLRLEARRAAEARGAEPGRGRARAPRAAPRRPSRPAACASRRGATAAWTSPSARERFEGLFGVEDVGDRGDSYDFDFAGADETAARLRDRASASRIPPASRASASSGASRCRARLAPGRAARSRERAELRAAHGAAPRVRARRAWTCASRSTTPPRITACASSSRSAPRRALRRPPPPSTWWSATSETPDDASWVQRAVPTFAQQGFVHAGGLSVVAPGLDEAELVQTERRRRHRAHAAARRRTSLAARPALAPRPRRPRHRHARRAVPGPRRGAALPLRRARPRRRARRRAAAARRARGRGAARRAGPRPAGARAARAAALRA